MQQLANDRIEDARILLDNGRWTAAYYLVGYAVETGLKVCILKFVEETGVIFTDNKFAEKCCTHRFEDLVKQANLKPTLGQDIGANPTLGGLWGVVEVWTEVSRYEQKTEADARNLYEAVTNDPDGVFPWTATRLQLATSFWTRLQGQWTVTRQRPKHILMMSMTLF